MFFDKTLLEEGKQILLKGDQDERGADYSAEVSVQMQEHRVSKRVLGVF